MAEASGPRTPLTRRRALALGGTLAGGLVAAGAPLMPADAASASTADRSGCGPAPAPALPVKHIERIIQAQGSVSDGVLSIEIDRDDLHVTGPGGIPFKPSWEVNGTLTFQSLPGKDRAAFNGDLALLAEELNPVIDAILAHGLVFQAEHQHYFGLRPMVWFIHFRGTGDPIRLAKAVAAVVRVTGAPLPQKPPAHPTTPLDADALARILHGSATVGADGVVTVGVPRRDHVVLGGVRIKPGLNIDTMVAFEPLPGPQHTAVGPDFSLIAQEVDPVVRVMRAQGFSVHCLYNQETGEQPQLYFSHQLAVGNAIDLAHKIRRGLDRTNSV